MREYCSAILFAESASFLLLEQKTGPSISPLSGAFNICKRLLNEFMKVRPKRNDLRSSPGLLSRNETAIFPLSPFYLSPPNTPSESGIPGEWSDKDILFSFPSRIFFRRRILCPRPRDHYLPPLLCATKPTPDLLTQRSPIGTRRFPFLGIPPCNRREPLPRWNILILPPPNG